MTHADPLAPSSFDDFIGQTALKTELSMHIRAARIEGKPLGHVFLDGPPGVGKTTMGGLIAKLVGDPFLAITMPFKPEDYLALLDFNGVVFLDEIHALSRTEQEELLPWLLNGYMRPKRGPFIETAWLTVIAATTEPDKVITPLGGTIGIDSGRFMLRPFFVDYTPQEMHQIISGMCEKAGVHLDPDDLAHLGRASAGLPRAAGRLVMTAKAMQTTGIKPTAMGVLELMQLTWDGLGPDHMMYLQKLYENMRKWARPVGLDQLRLILNTRNDSRIEQLERAVVALGYVERTPQGRLLTKAGQARCRSDRPESYKPYTRAPSGE